MVTEDDWYNGYFIPKNSIIMMNLWAIHHDPEDYPEPDKVGISYNYANDSINRNDS
jgi:cytochrome P450